MYGVASLLALWSIVISRHGRSKEVKSLFKWVTCTLALAFLCIGMTHWAPGLMASKPALHYGLVNFYQFFLQVSVQFFWACTKETEHDEVNCICFTPACFVIMSMATLAFWMLFDFNSVGGENPFWLWL
jgi:hypothetical protein